MCPPVKGAMRSARTPANLYRRDAKVIHANASGVIGKARRVALVVAVPLGFFAIWYAIAEAEIVGQIFIPHPQTIIDRVTLLWSELLGAIWVSLQMVVIGAFIGSVSGIFIGLLFGFSRLARDLFELTLDTIRPIPDFCSDPPLRSLVRYRSYAADFSGGAGGCFSL